MKNDDRFGYKAICNKFQRMCYVYSVLSDNTIWLESTKKWVKIPMYVEIKTFVNNSWIKERNIIKIHSVMNDKSSMYHSLWNAANS